jgi:preprotein translocase subunit YajC
LAVIVFDSRWLFVLADAAAPAAPGAAPEEEAAPPPGGGLTSLLAPLVIIGFLFYFMILRPQRAKEQRFRDMVAALKENDRVVTIGGIYGVVTNVQRDADRITIRIDETNNTKIRVASSAIARVLTDETESGTKPNETTK